MFHQLSAVFYLTTISLCLELCTRAVPHYGVLYGMLSGKENSFLMSNWNQKPCVLIVIAPRNCTQSPHNYLKSAMCIFVFIVHGVGQYVLLMLGFSYIYQCDMLLTWQTQRLMWKNCGYSIYAVSMLCFRFRYYNLIWVV